MVIYRHFRHVPLMWQ